VHGEDLQEQEALDLDIEKFVKLKAETSLYRAFEPELVKHFGKDLGLPNKQKPQQKRTYLQSQSRDVEQPEVAVKRQRIASFHDGEIDLKHKMNRQS